MGYGLAASPYSIPHYLQVSGSKYGLSKFRRWEFPLWHCGLRTRLQWLGSGQRCGFDPRPNVVAATAWFQSLAQEILYAMSVAIRKQKKIRKWVGLSLSFLFFSLNCDD